MEQKFSSFKEYADRAHSTTFYPIAGRNMVYPALKLAGEAGEVAEINIAKLTDRRERGVVCSTGDNR
jgi:hypothetical protein